MALISCPECKKQISETVDACPKCGYTLSPGEAEAIKKRDRTRLTIGCAVLLIPVLIVAFTIIFDSTKPTTPKPQTRQSRIESQFSKWDGSHIKFTQAIKNRMNDPKSYEHVKTTWQDMGSYIVVTTVFRGKNAFGGVVQNTMRAKADLNGNIIEILE